MTGNFDINKELLDAMRIIARQEIERCNRDITKTARVIAVNADETVKIEMDGKQYDNIPNYNGTTLSVNNIVKVTYPQGQASNMYVSGGGEDEIYSDFNNLKNSIVMINVTGFAIGIDGNNVIIQWLTGENREFGYALNIGITDGTMQFFYRENGTWKPSWNK
jgi:hypothetical protein